MIIASAVLVGIVALEHVYFMTLEMFLWRKPKGLKAFKMTQEYADTTATLAANQGLYNGFLAAGLVWGLLAVDPTMACSLRAFFLSCISVAGVYGGYSVNRRIFILQSIPALIALAVTLVAFCSHA